MCPISGTDVCGAYNKSRILRDSIATQIVVDYVWTTCFVPTGALLLTDLCPCFQNFNSRVCAEAKTTTCLRDPQNCDMFMYMYDLKSADYDLLYHIAHDCLRRQPYTYPTFLMLTYMNVSVVDFQTYFKQGSLAAISEMTETSVLNISKIALPLQAKETGTLVTYMIERNDTVFVRGLLENKTASGPTILYDTLAKYGVNMQPGLWVNNTQWLQYPGESDDIVREINTSSDVSYSRLGVILGTVIGFFTLLKIIFAIWFCRERKKHRQELPVSAHTPETIVPPKHVPWYRTSESSVQTPSEATSERTVPMQSASTTASHQPQRVLSRAQFWQQFTS